MSEKCHTNSLASRINMLKAGVWLIGHALVPSRPSTAPFAAALSAVTIAALCTTIRVPNTHFDVAGLQLLIAGLLLAATTCLLVAFRVRSHKTYPLAWLLVMIACVCCVVLT